MTDIKSLIVLSALVAMASAALVDKWQKTEDGTLYYVETEQKYNWFEAWNECARMNLSLLVIDSTYKHQQIDKLLKVLYRTCPPIWLAAHDNAVDGRYEWATTGKAFSFSNWAVGEPNRNNNVEHCLCIWEKAFLWYDSPCGSKHCFICEENPLLKAKDNELEDLRKNCQATSKFRDIILNVYSNQK